jgi:FkbM family methyltransferase
MLSNLNVLTKFINIQEKIQPDIAIEVGAYDGDFSKSMAKFNIDTYAFEASPYIYNKYKDQMSDVIYINKAVSDKDGLIKFEVQLDSDPTYAGNNSIKNRNEDKDYNYIDVESVSIYEYFKDKPFNKAVLWVDSEGANKEVLLGIKDRITDFASICIEVETQDFWKDSWKKDDVVEYLTSCGFLVLFELLYNTGQFDLIFINNKYCDLLKETVID